VLAATFALFVAVAGAVVWAALPSASRDTEPTVISGSLFDTSSQAMTTISGSRANEAPNRSETSESAGAITDAATGARGAPRPHIVQRTIPFPAKRRSEMAAYAERHYGIDTWRLSHPHVIVEHYTASESFSSAYNTFASDSPDAELGELPGTCAHFVIDKDGTIYQLVRTTIMCRHTVGLNYTAIGIEHVGMSDQEILQNARQLQASIALTAWLMQQKHIALGNVIGHNESLTSRYHRERYKPWHCQTHGDWNRADMDLYRAKLGRVARGYGISLGPAAKRIPPNC
jgi:N-acetylmuramoyl-L-alanine amidase